MAHSCTHCVLSMIWFSVVFCQPSDKCVLDVSDGAIRSPILLQKNSKESRPGLSNRDCPVRNKTIKVGIVLPSECIQLQGKWVRSWQSCGSLCTKNRACKA